MSKTNKVEQLQGNEPTKEVATQASTTELQNVENLASSEKMEHLLSNLEDMEASVSINSKYVDLPKGEPKRFAFLGFTKLDMQDDEATAAKGERVTKSLDGIRLMDKDKNVFVTSSVALVRIFKQANLELATPVEIVHTKIEKRVKLYDVKILRPKF